MLDQTVERVSLAVPSERTVIVTQQRHADYMAAEFRGVPTPRVLVQPESRGTAAVVLFPAHWIEGQRVLPELSDRLSAMAPFVGSEREAAAVAQAYASAPTANFSRAILETSSARLAVSRLPGLTWSDWGTPGRVLQSLQRAGISPPWLGRVIGATPDADAAAHAPAVL